MQLLIGGENQIGKLLARSLSLTDEANSRGTLGFTLHDKAAEYEPQIGSPVQLIYGGVTDAGFAGTIDELEKWNEPGTKAMWYRVSCIDYNQLADRRVVAKVYTKDYAHPTGWQAKDIVRDIVANFMRGEGITANVSLAGQHLIEKIVFNYMTVADCLDDICKLAAWKWNIDSNKVLWVYTEHTVKAPEHLNLTATSKNYRDFKIKRTREQYRNVQVIRGATAETQPQTEELRGNGNQRTWSLKFPINSDVSIFINTDTPQNQKTVSLQGEGGEWTYQKGSSQITQSTSQPVLQSTDVAYVTYTGRYSIRAEISMDNEISDRASIEGGSGIYTNVEYDENIDQDAVARKKAKALLALYGKVPRLLEWESDTPGWRAGQTVHITLLNYGLDEDFFIHMVTVEDVDGQTLRYRIQAVGSEAPRWHDFFRGLGTSASSKNVIRENEVIDFGRYSKEALRVSDALYFVTRAYDDGLISFYRPDQVVSYIVDGVGDAFVGYAEVSGRSATNSLFTAEVGLAVVGYTEVA